VADRQTDNPTVANTGLCIASGRPVKIIVALQFRGVATGPVGPVSTGPLFGQLKIFSFAKMKIITINCKIRASALYIT